MMPAPTKSPDSEETAVPALASTYEDVLASLRHVMSAAAEEVLPDILGRVESERLRGEARLRRLASEPVAAPSVDGDELLTLPQAAEFMGVPPDYAYTLARQRKLPTVRLPGLDRGGRTTAGKYVRVRRADLVAWLARHADDPAAQRLDATPSRARRRARVAVEGSTSRATAA